MELLTPIAQVGDTGEQGGPQSPSRDINELRSYLHKCTVDSLTSVVDAQNFLEALYLQENVVGCIERLRSSAVAVPLKLLQRALAIDTSPTFLHGPVAEFLAYIQDDRVRDVRGGDYLSEIVEAVSEPGTFWDALVAEVRRSYDGGRGTEKLVKGFAWLLKKCVELPPPKGLQYIALAADEEVQNIFKASKDSNVREFAAEIQRVLRTVVQPLKVEVDINNRWGRHDNDFADFRRIQILPTAQEFLCDELPLLRRVEEVEEMESCDGKAALWLDHQFRLLREDMLRQVKREVKAVLAGESEKQTLTIEGWDWSDQILCSSDTRKIPWTARITLKNSDDLPRLSNRKGKPADRIKFVLSHPEFVKDHSMACILAGREILAFSTIIRDAKLLAQEPPSLLLQLPHGKQVAPLLHRLKEIRNLKLAVLSTPFYAYVPVLRKLQCMTEVPFEEELLSWREGTKLTMPSLEEEEVTDMEEYIWKKVQGKKLDEQQAKAIKMAISSSVTLIHGSSGTGKTMIGAIITYLLEEYTTNKTLIVCHTNHELNQFLKHLSNFGTEETKIVRLGGRPTPKTAALAAQQQDTRVKLNRDYWEYISILKREMVKLEEQLQGAWKEYVNWTSVINKELIEEIELLPDGSWRQAFTVPQKLPITSRVVGKYYLLNRWKNGDDAGQFRDQIPKGCEHIWAQSGVARRAVLYKWKAAIQRRKVENLCNITERYNQLHEKLDEMYLEKEFQVICEARVIACTTTAAAKYSKQLGRAGISVLLANGAAGILESQVFAMLGPKMKQMILIGSHNQLRPKVYSYELTVESGNGYNLNKSLFERLVEKGYQLCTLTTNYRMTPPFLRRAQLSLYPSLKYGDQSEQVPKPKGLIESSLIWINHNKEETCVQSELHDQTDFASSTSKQNLWEVNMVVKITQYMVQQGYSEEQIAVLTPYTAQLLALKKAFKQTDNLSPMLVSRNLVQATSSSQVTRKRIYLSTIDNYQGSQRDIIIASMVRSNSRGDIGFMAQPERLNVLLSRTKVCLIMIGNANTFDSVRKVFESMWGRIMFSGLPTYCDFHNKSRVICTPEEFVLRCPDGGCSKPCGVAKNCGKHYCLKSCHGRSCPETECQVVEEYICDKSKHKYLNACPNKPANCIYCLEEGRVRNADLKRKYEEQMVEQWHNSACSQILEEIKSTQWSTALKKRRKEYESQQKSMKQGLENLELASRETLIESGASLPPSQLPLPEHPSPAKENWDRQKKQEGVKNQYIDTLMNMVGLENVKKQVLHLKAKVDIYYRQQTDIRGEPFNACFLGNPGTGKTTIAKLYGKLLHEELAIRGIGFEEITGAGLANGGIKKVDELVESLQDAGGGSLFIDEAHQLMSSPGGKEVLHYILGVMDKWVGEIVLLIAGYKKDMEKIFEDSPELSNRFPYVFPLEDYTEDELGMILRKLIGDKYQGRMNVEDGLMGLYMRIVIRRVGRGRNISGFSNARNVHNTLARITERQAYRVAAERRQGESPSDFLLTKQDLIGPDPSKAVVRSAAWKELQSMIGLEKVKESVEMLMNRIATNYLRELNELRPIELGLNRVFLGGPGTGKTSVAKLYGQILKELGVLSNGEVIIKNPSDFIGSALGESEKKTQGILAMSIGKILIIDEAYMLHTSNSDKSASSNDMFRTAVIDTLVAEVQNVPGDDRCVLLLGYEEPMREMFQNVNPGFARRFPLDAAFQFEDFSIGQLEQILEQKLKKAELGVTDGAKKVALEVLERGRVSTNFGNAGEVENLLSQAKERYLRRQATNPTSPNIEGVMIEADFDPDFDRASYAGDALQKLFEGVLGCEDVIHKLRGYQRTAEALKSHGKDPRTVIPTNFLFKGPPGTGKTTTARKLGRVFCDMGFLSSDEVIESSASEFIGQYVGQTGPKTRKKLESALGRVLFIDEAYQLNSSRSGFGTEAVNELVDCLTKPMFCGKLIVVLAGYEENLNQLLTMNPGLSSRFSEEIVFKVMGAHESIQLLHKELGKGDVFVRTGMQVGEDEYMDILQVMNSLVNLDGWGNARDVLSLAKTIIGAILRGDAGEVKDGSSFNVSAGEVIGFMKAMLRDRTARASKLPSSTTVQLNLDQPPPAELQPPLQPDTYITTTTTTTTATTESDPPAAEDEDDNSDGDDKIRIAEQDEASMQQKLREMGVCSAGYNWIKENGGWRCAGGSHWVSDHELC